MSKIDCAVVLAAGKSSRFNSKTPKEFHSICGLTMVEWVFSALNALGNMQKYLLTNEPAGFSSVVNIPVGNTCGTADTLKKFLEIKGIKNGRLLAVYGNNPLLSGEDILKLTSNNCGCAFFEGAFVFDVAELIRALDGMEKNSDSDEYELEDIAEALEGEYCALQDDLLLVSDRLTLSRAIRHKTEQINFIHMENGVTIIDPNSAYIDSKVKIGRDTVIYPGVYIEGNTIIGEGCTLYNGVMIKDSVIGDNAILRAVNMNGAEIQADVTVGPFVNIRPDSLLKSGSKVGDFVEIKNSVIGEGTKVPHLTYVGDADLGKRVNVGCGCVFVNYNGYKKQRSTVGDDAFLGCQTALVAPVDVGEGAYTAAGSTITKDVPKNALAVARARQENIENWTEKHKSRNNN